jgi:hypothetical protein
MVYLQPPYAKGYQLCFAMAFHNSKEIVMFNIIHLPKTGPTLLELLPLASDDSSPQTI